MILRLLSVLLLSVYFSLAWAKSVEVTGYGFIETNNIADARKVAIEDAKRVAIEQLFGTYISARTETNNFKLASEKIYSTAKGKLDSYVIIDESKYDDNTYKVNIAATIDEKAVRSHVDNQLNRYNWLKKPRIKFSASQVSGPGRSNLQNAFDTALKKALVQSGFTLLSHNVATPIYASFILTSNLESSIISDEYQGIKITNNQLLANVELVRNQTAIVVSTSVESAQKAGAYSINAMKDLATKLANRIAKRISIDTNVAWSGNHQQPVIVGIKGNIEQSDNILAFMTNWLVGIEDSSVELQDRTQTKIVIEYQGWPEQLFEQLTIMSKQNTVPFSIDRIQGDSIILTAK
jgi:hypothetical protein